MPVTSPRTRGGWRVATAREAGAVLLAALLLSAPFLAPAAGCRQQTSGVEVGQAAPEIEGETWEGKPLRLSDHRGKVVVLTFWGNW